MAETIEADICVIGAGSGGLSVAAGASQMGARTVLIEKGRMGGDCLNYGCVPSKALIAAAHMAHAPARAGAFGIELGGPRVDWGAVHSHVHDVIAAIAPNDSVARFEGLGVTVIQAAARFTDARTVEAGGTTVRARRFVVATGSSPLVPPIDGLDGTPFLTNETIFDNTAPVGHLIVVGGGPIGMELAQAHRRLGASVTVVEAARALGREDPEPAAILARLLRAEGIDIREGVSVVRAEPAGKGAAVTVRDGDGAETRIEGSHLLVAVGRRPNTDGLGLDDAGIEHDRAGIAVDAGLRTTNRRVFAIGDVAGQGQFTHLANHHAGVVIKRALFRLPAKADPGNVPRVTFTDPELAHVGLTEAEARDAGHKINVLRWSVHENDRAQAERAGDGLVKASVTPRGRILGATILARGAGELIQPWILARHAGVKIGDLAQMIAPYPTLGEVTKRAAGSFYTPKLFSERTRKIVRLLAKLG